VTLTWVAALTLASWAVIGGLAWDANRLAARAAEAQRQGRPLTPDEEREWRVLAAALRDGGLS
jgi:sterol desaturase/sphingolipid hydroxylase (fatty acid hydroxylase superfamily)